MKAEFRCGQIKKYVAVLCCAVFAAYLLFAPAVQAEESDKKKEAVLQEIEQTLQQILVWQCAEYDVQSVQELLDQGYSGNAVSGVVQTYILGLRGYEKAYAAYDFTTYEQALLEALQQPEGLAPASLQKSAMTLDALGAENPVPWTDLYETIGQKGIMTDIYGLLMLDAAGDEAYAAVEDAGEDEDAAVAEDAGEVEDIAAAEAAEISPSREDIMIRLLDQQLSDGGFALSGESGDVDVTAMAVQALAPYYQSADLSCGQRVTEAVDRAMEFLSEKQLPDGDFESYGNPCSESTAQVMLALCALNRDPFTEEAFIRNGHTVYDGLMKYRNTDGSFLHTLDGLANDMASSQAFYALSALLRLENGQCFLFDYASYSDSTLGAAGAYSDSDSTPGATGAYSDSDSTPEAAGAYSEPVEHIEKGYPHIDYRWCLSGVLAAGAVLYVLVLIKKKKINRKRLAEAGIVVVLLLLLIWRIRFQSKEAYLSGEADAGTGAQIVVSIEIRCDTVAGEKDYIPEDGVILAGTELSVPEGASAFDALKEAARLYDIQIEYTGGTLSHGFTYVEGIAYLYEFDFGDLSGWMYQVNGAFPSVGSGEYILSEEDRILWVYTTNLGKDVGGNGGEE